MFSNISKWYFYFNKIDYKFRFITKKRKWRNTSLSFRRSDDLENPPIDKRYIAQVGIKKFD